MSRSDIATVLILNTVGAVGAQVAPGRVVFEHRAEDHEQRAHAGGERANTRVGQAASTDGRDYGARDAGGAQSASIPKSARSTISTTCAIPILAPFPSLRHSHPCAIPILAPFPSFRHSHPSAMPILPSCPSFRHAHPSAMPILPPCPPLRHAHPSAMPILPPCPPLRHSHPCAIPILPSFPSFRHSCAPSIIPAPPPSFLRPSIIPAPPPSFLRPLRHSCAPSVIPAPPPSFLRPLRHSCGGRNPCDRPTVRRASFRPTAHQSPQRAAGDRAPSNIRSALGPTDRMDSCLRRNDGQGRCDGGAGVTEGASVTDRRV